MSKFTISQHNAKLADKQINEVPLDTEYILIENLCIYEDYYIKNIPPLVKHIHIENIWIKTKNQRRKYKMVVSYEDIEEVIEKHFIKIPYDCIITYDKNTFTE
jgi:hypothetical protein